MSPHEALLALRLYVTRLEAINAISEIIAGCDEITARRICNSARAIHARSRNAA